MMNFLPFLIPWKTPICSCLFSHANQPANQPPLLFCCAVILPRVDGQLRRNGVRGVHAHGGVGLPQLFSDVSGGERDVLLGEGPGSHGFHRVQLAQPRGENLFFVYVYFIFSATRSFFVFYFESQFRFSAHTHTHPEYYLRSTIYGAYTACSNFRTTFVAQPR